MPEEAGVNCLNFQLQAVKCRLADVEPKDSKTWSESVRLLYFIVVSIYSMIDISEIFYTLNT